MVHLVAGLLLTVLGICGIVAWWGLFGLVMRGVVPFFLLVLGLTAILSSCRRDSRESSSDGNAFGGNGDRPAAE